MKARLLEELCVLEVQTRKAFLFFLLFFISLPGCACSPG